MKKLRVILRGLILLSLSVILFLEFIRTGRNIALYITLFIIGVIVAETAWSYKIRDKYEMTSNFHLVLKWVIPLFVLVVIFFVFKVILYQEDLENVVKRLLIYSNTALVIVLVAYITIFAKRLKYIYGDQNCFIIFSIAAKKTIKVSDIIEIKKWFFLYKLEYIYKNRKKTVLVAPSYIETALSLFIEEENSIEKFKKLMS